MSEKENNMCDVCGSGYGRCGSCGNMCGFGGMHILRWVLGIIIITWVFAIGVRFGEIKAYLDESGYGYGHGYSHRVMPMMGGWSGGDQVYFNSVPASATVQAVQTGTVKLK